MNYSFWSEKNNAGKFLKFMPPLKIKLYKRIAEIISEGHYKNILDFGCGNGNQLEFLNNEINIDLYDINKEIARNAFLKYRQSKKVFLIDDINKEAKTKYSAIIVNMVWMCLESEVEVNKFFCQLKNLKQRSGIILLSMTHPCFRDELFSYYHTSYTTSERLFDYTKEGDAFDVIIKNEENSIFKDYHFSLTFYFKKLKEFGFTIVEFEEMYDEKYNLTINKRFTPYLLTIIK